MRPLMILMLAALTLALHATAGAQPGSSFAAAVNSSNTAAASDAPTSAVVVRMQVFRVLGNLSGDTSLTDDLWAGIDGPRAETKKAFSFFTQARLNLAGAKLEAGDAGWRWDGRDVPFGGTLQPTTATTERVMLVAQPTLKLLLGQAGALDIGAEQAIEYFEPRADGLYALKTVKLPTGLRLSLLAKPGPEERILLENLTIHSSLVESRKPVAGTTLNVGEPILASHDDQATINVRPGRDYGFLLHTSDGQGVLLARLRVEFAPAAPLTNQRSVNVKSAVAGR